MAAVATVVSVAGAASVSATSSLAGAAPKPVGTFHPGGSGNPPIANMEDNTITNVEGNTGGEGEAKDAQKGDCSCLCEDDDVDDFLPEEEKVKHSLCGTWVDADGNEVTIAQYYRWDAWNQWPLLLWDACRPWPELLKMTEKPKQKNGVSNRAKPVQVGASDGEVVAQEGVLAVEEEDKQPKGLVWRLKRQLPWTRPPGTRIIKGGHLQKLSLEPELHYFGEIGGEPEAVWERSRDVLRIKIFGPERAEEFIRKPSAYKRIRRMIEVTLYSLMVGSFLLHAKVELPVAVLLAVPLGFMWLLLGILLNCLLQIMQKKCFQVYVDLGLPNLGDFLHARCMLLHLECVKFMLSQLSFSSFIAALLLLLRMMPSLLTWRLSGIIISISIFFNALLSALFWRIPLIRHLLKWGALVLSFVMGVISFTDFLWDLSEVALINFLSAACFLLDCISKLIRDYEVWPMTLKVTPTPHPRLVEDWLAVEPDDNVVPARFGMHGSLGPGIKYYKTKEIDNANSETSEEILKWNEAVSGADVGLFVRVKDKNQEVRYLPKVMCEKVVLRKEAHLVEDWTAVEPEDFRGSLGPGISYYTSEKTDEVLKWGATEKGADVGLYVRVRKDRGRYLPKVVYYLPKMMDGKAVLVKGKHPPQPSQTNDVTMVFSI